MKSPRVEEQKGCRILGIFMLILNDLRRKKSDSGLFQRKAFASFYTMFLSNNFREMFYASKGP